MRKLIGSTVLAAVLLTMPLLATAQRRREAAPAGGPRHEMGVDLAFYFTSRGSGVGGGLVFLEPVDVRVNFLPRSGRSRVSFEPRLSLALDSKGTGTDATYVITPGLNVLYQLKRGTGTRNLMRAPYVTGGVQLSLVQVGAGAATASATQFSIGGGVGTRKPWGSAVFRPEAFVAYSFESDFLPHAFSIGTRVGLSFWH